MTAAALESPAGAALVQCCVQLYDRLAALTRLDDPDLLPAVGGVELRWRDGLSVSPHHVCCCLVGEARSRTDRAQPLSTAPPCGPLQDASLRWVATCFLQQDHPLVAAMKRQVSGWPACMAVGTFRCTATCGLLKSDSPLFAG